MHYSEKKVKFHNDHQSYLNVETTTERYFQKHTANRLLECPNGTLFSLNSFPPHPRGPAQKPRATLSKHTLYGSPSRWCQAGPVSPKMPRGEHLSYMTEAEQGPETLSYGLVVKRPASHAKHLTLSMNTEMSKNTPKNATLTNTEI